MLGGWWSTFIKNGITGPLQWPRQGMTLSFALMKIFHFHIYHFSFFSCLSHSPSCALFCFSALVCRWTQQDAFFSVLVNDDPLTMNLTTVTVNCSQSGRFGNICHTPPKISKTPQPESKWMLWDTDIRSQTYAVHCLVNILNTLAGLITMTLRFNWF